MTQTAVRVRSRGRAVDTDVPAPPSGGSVVAKAGDAVGYVLTKRTAYGNESEQLDEVRVPVFHTAPARVRVGGSVTQNLGDYNSARVEVMIEMPCLPEHSEIERVYQQTSTLVDQMIRRELSLATTGTAGPIGQQATQ